MTDYMKDARLAYRYPDGKVREFFYWGEKGAGPVIILPMTDQGEVIITKQWRAGISGFVYELPGGHPDRRQRVKDAVVAELRQETGYEAGSVIPLAEFWLDPPGMQVVIKPFLALGCKKVSSPSLDKDELMTHSVIPFGKWLTLITANASQNMKDSKSLSVTLLAIPELASRGLIKFPWHR